jgi:hypothetical protein
VLLAPKLCSLRPAQPSPHVVVDTSYYLDSIWDLVPEPLDFKSSWFQRGFFTQRRACLLPDTAHY